MKHPRTLIRDAVKERLVAQLPAIDPRISANRISIHRSTPLFAAKRMKPVYFDRASILAHARSREVIRN